MPHMSNLPWILNYTSIFIVFFSLLSYKYNDSTSNTYNSDNNKLNSKNQWTW